MKNLKSFQVSLIISLASAKLPPHLIRMHIWAKIWIKSQNFLYNFQKFFLKAFEFEKGYIFYFPNVKKYRPPPPPAKSLIIYWYSISVEMSCECQHAVSVVEKLGSLEIFKYSHFLSVAHQLLRAWRRLKLNFPLKPAPCKMDSKVR